MKACLEYVKHIVEVLDSKDGRVSALGDHLGTILSIARMRARKYKDICTLRKIAAYCLSNNISLNVRWIPSEFNPADAPSRNMDIPQPFWFKDINKVGAFSPPEVGNSLTHGNARAETQTCAADSSSSRSPCSPAETQGVSAIGSKGEAGRNL